jgi:hypothetical protein
LGELHFLEDIIAPTEDPNSSFSIKDIILHIEESPVLLCPFLIWSQPGGFLNWAGTAHQSRSSMHKGHNYLHSHCSSHCFLHIVASAIPEPFQSLDLADIDAIHK